MNEGSAYCSPQDSAKPFRACVDVPAASLELALNTLTLDGYMIVRIDVKVMQSMNQETGEITANVFYTIVGADRLHNPAHIYRGSDRSTEYKFPGF